MCFQPGNSIQGQTTLVHVDKVLNRHGTYQREAVCTMAIENLVHVNECGLPLNAISWLETHHQSKLVERQQMIRDLHLKRGSNLVDAGCGPGLWTPLLARALGPSGRIINVDVSAEALITAQQRNRGQWYEKQIS